MTKSDDQYRLNSRQRREIDQIGQKFHFNLTPPPSSLGEITRGPKFVSLTDFIEDWGLGSNGTENGANAFSFVDSAEFPV